MAAYNDQLGDEYYVDDTVGSFEQDLLYALDAGVRHKDLLYALDAGVRHTVNQTLAHAIRSIKYHLIGFAEQQGWMAPS
ncbi:hypothetical protein NDU88_001712 [Pleurodeles waltl]|uniref:Uncharacterized protein n=1 Tax=Pleurodeles waltl TaxID=8319 RepID=A0AAV7Q4H0_PLEWA|nr:hypothetical protein NDU88_001712 [Pleurodeles waltl]